MRPDLFVALSGSGQGGPVGPRTRAQLAAVRGSMWTARLDLPYGPRPGQPTNILAMDYYEWFSARDRARSIDKYLSLGLTHAVTGPFVDGGYHGIYPARQLPTQATWDHYLAGIREWHAAGITPVYFAKPDGWEQQESEMDKLDYFHRQDEAQELLPVVVYPGWEPSGDRYGWANKTYVHWLSRGADVFPRALWGLHTTSDLDAPTGRDDNITLGKNGNAVAWRRAAPYMHLWLDQLGGYVGSGTPTPSAEFMDELAKHMVRVRRGFREGYGDWPTFSAWGDNKPILHIAAEYAAYADFWADYPESVACDIGDAAMAAGADGYLDGGRVAVPVDLSLNTTVNPARRAIVVE